MTARPSAAIGELVFAFVDLETTGLSPAAGGKICEAAVLLYGPAGRAGSFSWLINPQRPMPPDAQAIHGITDGMLYGKPVFSEVAPKIISLISDSVVVCHNADFDVPFLACEFAAAGLRFPSVPVLDTLKYSRLHGKFKSNKLSSVARELGFSDDGAHRALADAAMTEHVFLHFLAKFKAAGAATLADLEELLTKKLRSAA